MTPPFHPPAPLLKLIFNGLLVVLLHLPSQALWGTAQFGDILIIGQDTACIYTNPLETYFEQKGSRKLGDQEMLCLCTALWRGYVATWQLEGDRLFLIRVQTNYCGDNPVDIDLTKEFSSHKVFAKWVNTTLVRPDGALLEYIHMGYASIFEREIHYRFKGGKLVATKTEHNLEYDPERLYPDADFLRDTIQSLIVSAISQEERHQFNEEGLCVLFINFDRTGQLKDLHIGTDEALANFLQKTILAKAQSVLKDFPLLMQINHKDFDPPALELWFSGYCLKHTSDRAYDCEED